MVEEIKQWIANAHASFEDGVILYLKYGNNSSRKDMLNKFGKNPFNTKNLGKWLKELLPTEKSVELSFASKHNSSEALPSAASVPAKPNTKTLRKSFASGELPSALEELRVQNGMLYKQMNINIHLFEKVKQNERKILRQQNIDYENQLRENWRVIDHWQVTGQIVEPKNLIDTPEEKAEPAKELTNAEALKKMLNLRSQISKAKKNIEKYENDTDKKQKYIDKLDGLEAELAVLVCNDEDAI